MKAKIYSSQLEGKITAPASKSSMQRACALALLAKGTTTLTNIGISNDDMKAIEVIKSLGAVVEQVPPNSLKITGSPKINPQGNTLNCGEAGLGSRMFTPIASLSNKKMTITGQGSLLTRPMNELEKTFPLLGINIETQNSKMPLTIEGPMNAKSFEIDGSLSSQYLTGFLICFASLRDPSATIHVSKLASKPYIDLTLSMIKDFGVDMVNNHYEHFFYQSGELKATNYQVESDWSGGAFLLVAGAILGNIEVVGLDIQSTQADKSILSALESAKADIKIHGNSIFIKKSPLSPFEFDATECPDLFPPLVVLAAKAEGKSIIKGTKRLTHKESNRALTLQKEMSNFGIHITLRDNDMIVEGKPEINAEHVVVHSHNDHRIAMANTLVGLRLNDNKSCMLHEAKSVNKSYTHFYKDLQSLSAKIEIL